MVNLVFDMLITFHTTYESMLGMQVRTYDQRDLADLSLFELYVSYPMQRALGHQLFWYAFPCCFLMPFILEPFFANYLPLHIAKLIVRSNAEFQGHRAEQALQFFMPMDLSRYADIMLNVCIAVCILFFPGGYVLQTFAVLCASHVYMYAYDQYRVLRAIPGLNIGSNIVDRCVNMLMALPCCILLSCLIFKFHCLPGYEDISAWKIIREMAIACTLHIVIHLCVVLFVIPRCGQAFLKHKRTKTSYAQAAGELPCSWFNANPIHCLRSKYIYHHNPPFVPYARGKEHLQTLNKSIGAYFSGQTIKHLS
jgi:hypothetical protein